MKIKEALCQGGKGAVLADEANGVVRLWTSSKPFLDGRVLRALRRSFPAAEICGDNFLRLPAAGTVLLHLVVQVAECGLGSRGEYDGGLIPFNQT